MDKKTVDALNAQHDQIIALRELIYSLAVTLARSGRLDVDFFTHSLDSVISQLESDDREAGKALNEIKLSLCDDLRLHELVGEAHQRREAMRKNRQESV